MIVEELWFKFGMMIHQDFLLDHPDFFSGIYDILQNFNFKEKELLHKYLIESIDLCKTNKCKLDIWINSGAEIIITEGQISDFFEKIIEIVTHDITQSNNKD